MSTMNCTVVAAALSTLLLQGCCTTNDSVTVQFRMESWKLSEGVAYVIVNNGDKVSGWYDDDYGSPQEIVWDTHLTEEQWLKLNRAAKPLSESDAHQEEYDPDISGGRLLRLLITSDLNGVTSIEYHNHLDPTMLKFLTLLNDCIPAGQLTLREWICLPEKPAIRE